MLWLMIYWWLIVDWLMIDDWWLVDGWSLIIDDWLMLGIMDWDNDVGHEGLSTHLGAAQVVEEAEECGGQGPASCKYRGHYSTPPPPCMGEVRTYSIHPHQPSYNLGFPPNGAVGPTGRICLPIPSSHSVILQLVTHLVRGMLRCSGVKVVNV